MNKEQAIKEAWGGFWDRLTENQKEYALKNNGSVQIGYSIEQTILYRDIVKSKLFLTQPMFPKSLQGIEKNNGWIKIESEANVPDEAGLYFVYSKTNWYPYYRIDPFSGRLKNSFEDGKSCFTHYQPIEKPKPPIY